jgi:hypothetical protein
MMMGAGGGGQFFKFYSYHNPTMTPKSGLSSPKTAKKGGLHKFWILRNFTIFDHTSLFITFCRPRKEFKKNCIREPT